MKQIFGWTDETPPAGYAGYLMAFDAEDGRNVVLRIRPHQSADGNTTEIAIPLAAAVGLTSALNLIERVHAYRESVQGGLTGAGRLATSQTDEERALWDTERGATESFTPELLDAFEQRRAANAARGDAAEASDRLDVRERALGLAVSLFTSPYGVTPDGIVAAARTFEAYLLGDAVGEVAE